MENKIGKRESRPWREMQGPTRLEVPKVTGQWQTHSPNISPVSERANGQMLVILSSFLFLNLGAMHDHDFF